MPSPRLKFSPHTWSNASTWWSTCTPSRRGTGRAPRVSLRAAGSCRRRAKHHAAVTVNADGTMTCPSRRPRAAGGRAPAAPLRQVLLRRDADARRAAHHPREGLEVALALKKAKHAAGKCRERSAGMHAGVRSRLQPQVRVSGAQDSAIFVPASFPRVESARGAAFPVPVRCAVLPHSAMSCARDRRTRSRARRSTAGSSALPR